MRETQASGATAGLVKTLNKVIQMFMTGGTEVIDRRIILTRQLAGGHTDYPHAQQIPSRPTPSMERFGISVFNTEPHSAISLKLVLVKVDFANYPQLGSLTI